MYKHIALGGTFDLLHIGHIALLKKAFFISKFVSIGITTDKFCQGSGKFPYENQTRRRGNLISYLAKNNLTKRSKIIWLHDIYGTTLKDETIEAIVVSKNSRRGAEIINIARAAIKLKKLKIIEVPIIRASDGKIITTGRIRKGQISPNGANYQKLLIKIADVRFSQKIRQKLKIPFGKFAKSSSLKKLQLPTITVGDITTAKFLKLKIAPSLAIVDFLVNRKRAFKNLQELGFIQPNPDYLVKNTPGQISTELIRAIKKAFENFQKQVILVNGEEDLAFIPALLLAPIPSVIFYGQPRKGLVRVDVAPDTKSKLCSLLNLTRAV